MIYTIFLLALLASTNASPCGLEHVSIVKATRQGKEYAFVDAKLDIYGAINWCESEYMASEEIGFPFGKLLKPTTEELIWVRENLIPDASAEFNTGYYTSQSQYEDTPEAFGVVFGHGTDAEKHWVEGEPDATTGVVYSTNKANFDPASNRLIPLFSTSSMGTIRPFVCVREISEAFPANMGTFNDEYECENITKRDTYGLDTEVAFINQKLTLEEALPICEGLAKEGFPNSRLAVLDTNKAFGLRHMFTLYEDFWSAHKYDSSSNEYLDLYDGQPVGHSSWDLSQPSSGDCVIGTSVDQWLFGALETDDCSNKHVFACERPTKMISNVATARFSGKEYILRQGRDYYKPARDICEASGSKLFQPTEEELNFVLKNLIPGSFQIWLGYDMEDYEGEYSPAAYGITEGKYGYSLSQWKEGEPDCIGGITVTTQLAQDPQTGALFPLLTCSAYHDEFHFVCEKDLEGNTRNGDDSDSSNQESEGNAMVVSGGFLVAFGVIAGLALVVVGKLKQRNGVVNVSTSVTNEHTL